MSEMFKSTPTFTLVFAVIGMLLVAGIIVFCGVYGLAEPYGNIKADIEINIEQQAIERGRKQALIELSEWIEKTRPAPEENRTSYYIMTTILGKIDAMIRKKRVSR